MSIKISIALIHNCNNERNINIQPSLDKLASRLNNKYKTEIFYIYNQPAISPHGIMVGLYRSFIYHLLEIKWRKYRKIKRLKIIKQLLSFLSTNIKRYILSKKYGVVWNKNSFIETLVTDKHARAWSRLLDSDSDFLLVFEDDVLFKENSIENVISLLGNLIQFVKTPLYIDLAGGCDLKELKIDLLETDMSGGFISYGKPVTNTACCYLLNKSLALLFIEVLVKHPSFRLIGVDWLMNQIFMIITKKNKIICKHASPPFFMHGSITGEYQTWQGK